MSFFKKIFQSKDKPIQSYADFWDWFSKHQKKFYQTVKNRKDIEANFFEHLSPKLAELHDGYYFLTGMYDDNTVELVYTPDGVPKNIVFVEELVHAAPVIKGWKFTALKPALDLDNCTIRMAGFQFNKDNLRFYANEDAAYPDEIDITIVHDQYQKEEEQIITNGSYIFLDNLLGELNFALIIDRLKVIGKEEAKKELVPIEKLKSFLTWRQKEFVEKYEGLRRDTENDGHTVLQATYPNGDPLIAVLNTDLLKWDGKASHPWILKIDIKYDGTDYNGLPHPNFKDVLDEIEEELMKDLKDFEGYLNIGRQSAQNVRTIYFACKEFRKPSKVTAALIKKYADQFEMSYDIYKDKYWKSFRRFGVD